MLAVPVLRRTLRASKRVSLNTSRSLRRTCLTSTGQASELPSTETVSAEGNVLGQLDPLRKVGIVFTCTVCQTRSAKSFSYQSYTKGVVIIRCPSCENNHLIADNLGWFKDDPVNVETMAKEKGQKVRRLANLEELNTEEDVEGIEKFKELFNEQIKSQKQPQTSE